MAKTLVISGHPHLEYSVANKAILDRLEEAKKDGLDLDIDYLDRTHGNFDVEAEQNALRAADTIVLQFPIYWYNYPALMKKYIEEVFAHGFAYGSTGTALQGKNLILSITVGSPEATYSKDGPQHHPLSEFLYNIDQIALMTGLKPVKRFVTYGCMYVPGLTSDEDKEKIVHACEEQADQIVAELKKL